MDALLPQLLSFPPHPPPLQPTSDAEYDRQMRSLVGLLNRTSASSLIGGVNGGGDLLDILDPSINSLPYLYTLLAHIQASQDRQSKSSAKETPATHPPGPLWNKIVDFLTNFDSRQVRYAGLEWRRIIEVVDRTAKAINKPIIAIRLIRTAILRLDPTSTTLTTNHVIFLRHCLEAKCFRDALPIIDRDILEFAPHSRPQNVLISTLSLPSSSYIYIQSGLTEKLTYRSHLEYHLFAALIYIGLKNWERALQFLTFVIAAPTVGSASTIQVEAYKKWVIVGLIHRGEPMPIPKTANNAALKSCRDIAKPYDAFAEVFKSGNATRLREEFEIAEDIWKIDNNYGLMLIVLDAFHRFNIRHLEDTYRTLSVDDISQRDFVALDTTSGYEPSLPLQANEAATEQYILAMIARGELNATLSHPPNSSAIVHFNHGTSRASEVEQLQKVERQIERTMAVTQQIKNLDRKMALSKEYVSWLAKNRKNPQMVGAQAPGGNMLSGSSRQEGTDSGLEAMDLGWDEGPVMDEDMMEGYEP